MFKLISISLIFTTCVYANKTADNFEQYKSYAKSLSPTVLAQANKFNPNSIFKNYTDNPAEVGLYDTKDGAIDLNIPAQAVISQDPMAKQMKDNFKQSQFNLDVNDPAIARALLIESESYAITHNISTENVHCKAHENVACNPVMRTEICTTSRQLAPQQCTKKLQIDVQTKTLNQAINLNLAVHKNFTGIINVNLVSGVISGALGGSLSSTIDLAHGCTAMNVAVNSISNNGEHADWVSVASIPSCSNNGMLLLNITKSFKREYNLQIALLVRTTSNAFIASENWDNSCTASNSNLCHIDEEVCTDTTNPHVIGGLSITRDCWGKTVNFSCKSAQTDECSAQKAHGCKQIASKCALQVQGECMQYEQIYQCANRTCVPEIVCAQDVFCIDGDCVDHNKTENTDFAKDITPIAAMSAAGGDYRNTQVSLFGGHVAQCKIWLINAIDCCSDKGWGKALHLLNCRDEDKQLGQAKLNYVAHYLGEFCAKKELGVCVEQKRSYCVFDSKIARIVQEQGRLAQLNPAALGSAEDPNCSGLSIEEFQKLDMSKIDFIKPIYPAPPAQGGVALEDAGIVGDIKTQIPDDKQLSDAIKKRVEDRMAKIN